MKTRNKMKKLEQEKFVVPKTVQNVIPIKAVYKDGIFLVGKNMYSKTFLFTDVNYYIACENEKNDLMRQYWAVINSFGNGVTVKLTINNHRFDKEDFENQSLCRITMITLMCIVRNITKCCLIKRQHRSVLFKISILPLQ